MDDRGESRGGKTRFRRHGCGLQEEYHLSAEKLRKWVVP